MHCAEGLFYLLFCFVLFCFALVLFSFQCSRAESNRIVACVSCVFKDCGKKISVSDESLCCSIKRGISKSLAGVLCENNI